MKRWKLEDGWEWEWLGWGEMGGEQGQTDNNIDNTSPVVR